MTKVITEKEAEELTKALEVGSTYNGQTLQVEALPNCMFAGTIHMVLENETGETHLVQMTSYSKDTGLTVCIRRNDSFVDLLPGQYEILEVLSWNPETDELKPVSYINEENS
jgi:hypothetical protein